MTPWVPSLFLSLFLSPTTWANVQHGWASSSLNFPQPNKQSLKQTAYLSVHVASWHQAFKSYRRASYTSFYPITLLYATTTSFHICCHIVYRVFPESIHLFTYLLATQNTQANLVIFNSFCFFLYFFHSFLFYFKWASQLNLTPWENLLHKSLYMWPQNQCDAFEYYKELWRKSNSSTDKRRKLSAVTAITLRYWLIYYRLIHIKLLFYWGNVLFYYNCREF